MYWSNNISGGVLVLLALAGLATLRRATRSPGRAGPGFPLPGARTQIPWRPSAGWEHMMSLNYRQRYQLRLVKAGVRRSDPLLCAVFGMFGRLCPGALCYDGGDWRG